MIKHATVVERGSDKPVVWVPWQCCHGLQTARWYVKPNSAMSRTGCRRKGLKCAAGEGWLCLVPAFTLARDKGKQCPSVCGGILPDYIHDSAIHRGWCDGEGSRHVSWRHFLCTRITLAIVLTGLRQHGRRWFPVTDSVAGFVPCATCGPAFGSCSWARC
jgi:hypothetical protein